MAEPDFYTYKSERIATYTFGKGRNMIVLHGWGSSSKVMMPICQQLSDIRRCTLIDLPGFGRTGEPQHGWAISDYADLINKFIKERSLETPDFFVHSFGNRVLLKLLSEYPLDAQKLLITGGAGLKPKRKPSYYFKKYTAKTLKAPFKLLPDKLEEKGLSALRKTDLWKSLGSSDYQNLSSVMRETFVKTVTEHLDEALKNITNEALLLWGEDDTATPLDQAKRMEKGLVNGALVTLTGAGHYAFLDQPAKFERIARAFLNPEA